MWPEHLRGLVPQSGLSTDPAQWGTGAWPFLPTSSKGQPLPWGYPRAGQSILRAARSLCQPFLPHSPSSSLPSHRASIIVMPSLPPPVPYLFLSPPQMSYISSPVLVLASSRSKMSLCSPCVHHGFLCNFWKMTLRQKVKDSQLSCHVDT